MNFTYLDIEKLHSLDGKAFLETKPYPWVNPEGVLTENGFKILMENLPSRELFTASFGIERNYGQAPHDRYELFYTDAVPVPTQWKEFIQELQSDEYHAFIQDFFQLDTPFVLRFQWHYAISGCSVSPHVDSYKKLGSHLFYLNTSDDWKEEWGGSTVVLSHTSQTFSRQSAPQFSEFDVAVTAQTLNNRSFLFKNMENGWHGVYPLTSSQDAIRRMFAVVIDKMDSKRSLLTRAIARFKKVILD